MQMTTSFMLMAAPSLMCMMISLFVLSWHRHGTELIFKGKLGQLPDKLWHLVATQQVRSTECLKLLGVCIDKNNLRFDEHINSISKKSSQQVDVLKRLRNLTPRQTKLQLYKAAVLPYLTYCHLIWHFYHSSDSR